MQYKIYCGKTVLIEFDFKNHSPLIPHTFIWLYMHTPTHTCTFIFFDGCVHSCFVCGNLSSWEWKSEPPARVGLKNFWPLLQALFGLQCPLVFVPSLHPHIMFYNWQYMSETILCYEKAAVIKKVKMLYWAAFVLNTESVSLKKNFPGFSKQVVVVLLTCT